MLRAAIVQRSCFVTSFGFRYMPSMTGNERFTLSLSLSLLYLTTPLLSSRMGARSRVVSERALYNST